jgi:hypothetical protein
MLLPDEKPRHPLRNWKNNSGFTLHVFKIALYLILFTAVSSGKELSLWSFTF